ncbi:hydroxymethylbilane synthase [Levilactobacillus cerevisiae]|uniref:hydroxymethylbilane synthase n=1 Tax=Levilactobacillus cerevisiae TaxID=1704076 RepID=UPI000F7AAAFF|nr:hydroxymethylbilane synthase [Levilactobacillus cerevisiae]
MKNKIIIGSRRSLLAMTQTQMVADDLHARFPQVTFEIKQIVTTGDVNLKDSLQKIGGKGVFVEELENELKSGEIDFAVHSLKDVMPVLPAGLMIGSVPQRNSPYDCLISRRPISSLADLPQHARIGTNSSRRQGQLLHLRPDLEIIPTRGNVDTRVKKLDTENLDAVVLAEAGLNRLGIDLTGRYRWSLKDVLLPAMGQGAMAIECREDDADVRQILATINDPHTATCVGIEREYLREVGGTCTFPIGGFAVVDGDHVTFEGLIASTDGQHVLRETQRGQVTDHLGKLVAQHLLAQDKFGIMKGSQN